MVCAREDELSLVSSTEVISQYPPPERISVTQTGTIILNVLYYDICTGFVSGNNAAGG
jgi:hypothetical protein